ncbi:MAG: hypothetical protein PF689_11000 [Deltaproteobacteria bacterium]|jgi:hypothetical protein|nr:hypothetical protein [Deltaproteobacteria bacterium]
MKISFNFFFYLKILLALHLLSSCTSSKGTSDPLKNTKKLVKRGHSNLYQKGALRIPNTSINLIPAGPKPLETARNLIGLSARNSFLLALKRASDSVYIIAEGSKLSLKAGQKIYREMSVFAEKIRKLTRKNAILILDKNGLLGGKIIGKSWKLSRKLLWEINTITDDIITYFDEAGNKVTEKLDFKGDEILLKTQSGARNLRRKGIEEASTVMHESYTNFITGYLTLPAKLVKNLKNTGKVFKKANLVKIAKDENKWRQKYSDKSIKLIKITGKNYFKNMKISFKAASSSLKNYKSTGISLASLKALTYTIKGIVWDGIIQPLFNFSAGCLGFVAINGIAYPLIVLSKEGKAVAQIAVSTIWNTTKSAWQIAGPTVEIAIAGVYSFLTLGVTQVAALGQSASGTIAGYSTKAAGQIAGLAIKGTGQLSARTTGYIGVPLAAAGVFLGGTITGTVVSAYGTIPAGAILLGGEGAAIASRSLGTILGGTTAIAGTTAISSWATAKGLYYVAKAVSVPSSYTLGAGIVLGYGAISHLAAHALLGVSDCAYLVLSLEGPRWVVYAIQGKLGEGKKLPPGTVLNLNKMQKAGEKFKYIPVSSKKMKKVIKSTHNNLKVQKKSELSTILDANHEQPSKKKKEKKKENNK